MLAAGAVEAYLIQVADDTFEAVSDFLDKEIGHDTLIICESGRLPGRIKAGVSLFVRQLNCQVRDIAKKIPLRDIDRMVTNTVNGFDFDLNEIRISEHSWKLKTDERTA